MRHEAKLTSKGQLTLPVRLRESLSLRPGDKVVFVEDSAGHVTLETRGGSFSDLRGIVRMTEPADIESWINDARSARAGSASPSPGKRG